MRTTKVIINALPGLLCRQFPLRLHNGSLAMDPTRLNGIEPGALDRQQAGEDSYPALSPGSNVMSFEPVSDPLTDVPGGVIPYQEQGLLTFPLQFLADPLQEGYAHLTDGTAFHEAQQHSPGVGTQQPIASQGYWVRVLLVPVFLYQAQRSPLINPTMQGC